MMEIAVKAVWAAMPADVSLLHLLFYIASAGKLDLLLDTDGGAQQDRFVEGAGTLAAAAGGDARRPARPVGAPVRRIEHGADGVHACTADGVEVRAQRAIVAVPPTLAGRIPTTRRCPGYRDQLTQRVPMGAVIKCLAVYDEPFWRTRRAQRQRRQRRRPAHADRSTTRRRTARPGSLVGFLEGRSARELGRVSDAERRRAPCSRNLARLFGPRAAQPERYLDKSWADEEWSRGCYVGYTPPGVLTAFGPALREPIGPMHWAGTETATVWNGYMDGAIQSGERAAREVLAALAGEPPVPAVDRTAPA